MSDEQIAVAQRALDAIGRRDLEAMLELAAPDIVLRPLMSVWPRPYTGLDGIERWWADVEELWADFSVTADSFRALDEETLLISVHWRGLPKGTAAEVAGPASAIIRFRDGKAISVELFLDEAAALRSHESEGEGEGEDGGS